MSYYIINYYSYDKGFGFDFLRDGKQCVGGGRCVPDIPELADSIKKYQTSMAFVADFFGYSNISDGDKKSLPTKEDLELKRLLNIHR